MKLWKSMAAAVICLTALVPILGGAFVPVGDVAPIADLEAETAIQRKTLENLLKDNASYEEMMNKKKLIPRAAGVLAVMGQAIAEHPDHVKTKIAGPELRDAARKMISSKSYEDAVVALREIHAALAGKKTGASEKDFPWNKLMSLHRLMEEAEDRHGDLRAVFMKAQKGQQMEPADAVTASTLAMLALVIHADHHEVRNLREIPEWETMSQDFLKRLADLSRAIHKGDAEAVKKTFPLTTKSCTVCHDKFRH